MGRRVIVLDNGTRDPLSRTKTRTRTAPSTGIKGPGRRRRSARGRAWAPPCPRLAMTPPTRHEIPPRADAPGRVDRAPPAHGLRGSRPRRPRIPRARPIPRIQRRRRSQEPRDHGSRPRIPGDRQSFGATRPRARAPRCEQARQEGLGWGTEGSHPGTFGREAADQPPSRAGLRGSEQEIDQAGRAIPGAEPILIGAGRAVARTGEPQDRVASGHAEPSARPGPCSRDHGVEAAGPERSPHITPRRDVLRGRCDRADHWLHGDGALCERAVGWSHCVHSPRGCCSRRRIHDGRRPDVQGRRLAWPAGERGARRRGAGFHGFEWDVLASTESRAGSTRLFPRDSGVAPVQRE